MATKMLLSIIGIIQVFMSPAHGFYVPGVAPVEFKIGDNVEVKAVKMTSVKTQLPYEYYSLAFCHPPEGIKYKTENLGEVLRGDRIVNTAYDVKFGFNKTCEILCKSPQEPSELTEEESKEFAERIKKDYYVHLLVDNLPCATKFSMLDTSEIQYEHGYRLGYVKDGEAYLNNHLKLILKYHKEDELDLFYSMLISQMLYTCISDINVIRINNRVVGFEVVATSVDLKAVVASGKNCSFKGDLKADISPQLVGKGKTKLLFTYEVSWEKSEIRWASRWDTYLTMSDVQIHWFSIINSVVVVFFLSGILTMIMVRTLRKDIAKYNRDEDIEETIEESGWKLVHGDVFRPPKYTRLLASLLGAGTQIFSMALITIFVAMLGMLSPSSRGALMTAAIVLFVFMGVIAGYFAGRLYKTMKGAQWKKSAFQTATIYPGIVFGSCFFLNFFIWGKHSSGAVPFTTMLALLCMWFGISVPLVFIGYYFGYRKKPYEHPVRTNQIPRQVPEQMWYMSPALGSMSGAELHDYHVDMCSLLDKSDWPEYWILLILMAGILPFGAMFIELFFIFTAIWENQFYYLFGFLFLVFIILVISVSQISIVMVYFQLCGESLNFIVTAVGEGVFNQYDDYHWWWRSFIVSGGSAVYVFAYSIFYFITKLEITEFIPTLLYFGYTFLMVVTFWMLTGTIGFYASYFFIRKIYGAIKID